MNNEDLDEWPQPDYDEQDQPHFLFIITPPFSGSTALALLLNTSPRTMFLQERGEGQWLVPGLCQPGGRWRPDKYVNYESVKAVWLNRYQSVNSPAGTIDVVIEKSPPNMVRIEKLSALFRSCSFLANNRNPYANCSSILYRNHDAENIGAEQRAEALNRIANGWVGRSTRVRELVQAHDIPLVTYEEFCQNPMSVPSVLKTPEGVAEGIDTGAHVKVKDYELQALSNQNERQIARLTAAEIRLLTRTFNRQEELLGFFGYQLLPG